MGVQWGGGSVIIIPGFSRCIRPCPRTNTGFLHYESLQNISAPITNCEEFIRKTGYSGLFSIEFLRDKQGQDYFMEINFRNDGNAICVTASGFNLPYLWYLSNTTSVEIFKEEVAKLKLHSVYVMPEFADFDNFVRTSKISFLTWLKDVIKTDAFMVFNLKDLSPFLYIFKERIKNVFKRVLHIK